MKNIEDSKSIIPAADELSEEQLSAVSGGIKGDVIPKLEVDQSGYGTLDRQRWQSSSTS